MEDSTIHIYNVRVDEVRIAIMVCSSSMTAWLKLMFLTLCALGEIQTKGSSEASDRFSLFHESEHTDFIRCGCSGKLQPKALVNYMCNSVLLWSTGGSEDL